jgi:hypothetical protein
MTICRRTSVVCARASCRSVHHGLTASRAPGDDRAARDGGHGAGPVSTGSDAVHIRSQVAMNRAHSSPAPGRHASSAVREAPRSEDRSKPEPSAKR